VCAAEPTVRLIGDWRKGRFRPPEPITLNAARRTGAAREAANKIGRKRFVVASITASQGVQAFGDIPIDRGSRRNCGSAPSTGLKAKLEIEAVEKAPVLRVRHDKLGTQFGAIFGASRTRS
jgi:hypothetical protein